MLSKAAAAVSVPVFDELFDQSGVVTVDRSQMIDCKKFFDSDPNVQTGFEFRLGALLNGGIVVKRKGQC